MNHTKSPKVTKAAWNHMLSRVSSQVTRKNKSEVNVWFDGEFFALSSLEIIHAYGGEVVRCRYSLKGNVMWLTVREPVFTELVSAQQPSLASTLAHGAQK